MAKETSPDTRIPSVVLLGHCKAVLSAAMVFKQLNWNVGILCDKEHQATATGALGAFPSEGTVRVETKAEQIPFSPEIVVRCGCPIDEKGLSVLLGPTTTQIELVGVRVDDGAEPAWSSCSDLVAYMRSGLGVLTRIRDEGGIHGLPYLAAGHLASFFLGLHAAMLGNAVLMSPSRPRLISVSSQECLLATLHNAIGFAQIDRRDAGRKDDPPKAGGRFECRDGIILITMPEAHQWARLIEVLGDPELAKGDWWKDRETRDQNRDRVSGAIAAWCAHRTRDEVFTALQEAGVPAAYLSSAEDIFANKHLRARGFFTDAPEGVYPFNRPFRVEVANHENLPAKRDVDPPRLERWGSGEEQYLPLKGLRVCDVSWAWAGPFLTERLAMLGALVVKVESRDRIDTHRVVPPYAKVEGEQYDRAFGHFVSTRGKLSIVLDMKHPEGLQAMKDLIAQSDLLISNFAPGAMERLGLGFDVVSNLVGQRGFVHIALSGFGATGPWRSYRSYGAQLADLTGLNGLTGTPETPPISMGIPFGDPTGGTFGAAAALHYLRESRASGRPIKVEISQYELLISGIADALLEGRATGNKRRGDLPGTGVYPCREPDTWIVVSVTLQEAARRLAEMVGAFYAQSADLETRLASWIAQRSCADAASALLSQGIECTEVLSAAELLNDRSLLASGYWDRLPEDLLTPGAPWLVDGRRAAYLAPAPRLGEHTDRVAREILGYSEERIRDLRHSGALS